MRVRVPPSHPERATELLVEIVEFRYPQARTSSKVKTIREQLEKALPAQIAKWQGYSQAHPLGYRNCGSMTPEAAMRGGPRRSRGARVAMDWGLWDT